MYVLIKPKGGNMSNEKNEKNSNNANVSQNKDGKSVDKKADASSYRKYVDSTPKELIAYGNFILSDT
jgi:hypothetical protein